MRRKIAVLAVLMGLFILLKAGYAEASFFDDGRPYMASDQWTLYSEGDPGVATQLLDQDSKLKWITTPGWTNGVNAVKVYYSNWGFLTSSNFDFSVQFHYDHKGTYDNDAGGVMLGAVTPDIAVADGIEASNWAWSESGKIKGRNVFSSGDDNWARRTYSEGKLSVNYNVNEDRLEVQGWEDFGEGLEQSYNYAYTGLKNLPELRVYLGGWAEGASLDGNNSYLYNFQKGNGQMTPEPISSSLFIVGGVVLLAAKLRKKI